jgi:hypothetical protein
LRISPTACARWVEISTGAIRGESLTRFLPVLLGAEQAARDRGEVLAKFGDAGALAHLQLGVDQAQGADPMLDVLQMLARFQVGDALELKMNQADQALVVVLDPMLQFLQQELMLRGQAAVQLAEARLLDREGEQRGVALQKLDVVLGEHARLAAVGFQDAEIVALVLMITFAALLTPCSRSSAGMRKRSSLCSSFVITGRPVWSA